MVAALVALGLQSHSPCTASMMLSTPQNHSFLTPWFGLGHRDNLKQPLQPEIREALRGQMQVTSKAGHHVDLPRSRNSKGQTTKMEIKDWGWRFYFNLFSFPRVTLNTRHTMLDHTGLSCSSLALKILREEYRVPRSCSRDTETDKTQTDRQTLLFKHCLTSFSHDLGIPSLFPPARHHTSYFTSTTSCNRYCEQALDTAHHFTYEDEGERLKVRLKVTR